MGNDLDGRDGFQKHEVEGEHSPQQVAGDPEQYTCGMNGSLPDCHLFTRFPTRFVTQFKRVPRLLRTNGESAPDRVMSVTRYALTSDPSVSIEVVSASLACCTLELQAALSSGALIRVPETDTGPSVIVIAGTVTDALLPGVIELIHAHPGIKVMSFGACATSGGPYWDSPPVSKGIDQFVKVAAYVAGCPPRPDAFIQAIQELSSKRVS